MTREEVLHLADLSRIELTDAEIERFTKDFSDILSYIDQIKDLAGGAAAEPSVGLVHNVFREDTHPRVGGEYTEDLLTAAPAREGRYLKVKKILGG